MRKNGSVSRLFGGLVLLALGVGRSFALDVEVVGSFSTEGITPAPVFSVAVDEANELLLLGDTDGDILEVTPDGKLVRSLIAPALRRPTMARGLAVMPSLELFFHQGRTDFVGTSVHRRSGEFETDFIFSSFDTEICPAHFCRLHRQRF